MHRILWTMVIFAASSLGPLTSGPAVAGEAKGGAKSSRTPDCVYVGTPYDVIDRMLDVASIKKTDLVYDLGCGDGRIVVAASKRFGCSGVGYDISPERVEESLENVRKNRVDHLVRIEQEDIFTLDLGPVDVVMLYLLPDMNRRLIPQLEELRPGSRIVSHDYSIEGIREDKYVSMTSLEDGVKHYIYLYTAPLTRE